MRKNKDLTGTGILNSTVGYKTLKFLAKSLKIPLPVFVDMINEARRKAQEKHCEICGKIITVKSLMKEAERIMRNDYSSYEKQDDDPEGWTHHSRYWMKSMKEKIELKATSMLYARRYCVRCNFLINKSKASIKDFSAIMTTISMAEAVKKKIAKTKNCIESTPTGE